MKTPYSDHHPFARFRREQRFMSTPLGAFHVWLEDQHREASEMLSSEFSERVTLAAQVVQEIEQTIRHIEAFREVMHEHRNPSA